MAYDLIADMLTRVRNAQRIGLRSVRVRDSRMVRSVLEVLKREGLLESFQVCKDRNDAFSEVEVTLKYYGPHQPVITKISRVSRSGRRVYAGYGDLPAVSRGLGMSVVSTSQGVMSDREARRKKIGGEVVAVVS